MLDLRRTANAEGSPDPRRNEAPGRPIIDWEPHDLEVHPAGLADGREELRVRLRRELPSYVPRRHDKMLAEVVRDVAEGPSRGVFLVGTSSTGKTRACFEAIQPLAEQGWRLWHPLDPTRAEAAMNTLEDVLPYTVVWLNEAQHYLGDPQIGERIAAALYTLLSDPRRGPVLFLGTLWPEYAKQYRSLPSHGEPDSHSRVRELLAGRCLGVPELFGPEELRTATAFAEAGDRLMADALTRSRSNGRVTQDLAGAPELLHSYQHGSPTARAVLEVAMDARRLGVGLYLPQPFLIDAAFDYLGDYDSGQLIEDWAEAALAELVRPVHGKQAPLSRGRTRPQRFPSDRPSSDLEARPVFRLAFSSLLV